MEQFDAEEETDQVEHGTPRDMQLPYSSMQVSAGQSAIGNSLQLAQNSMGVDSMGRLTQWH